MISIRYWGILTIGLVVISTTGARGQEQSAQRYSAPYYVYLTELRQAAAPTQFSDTIIFSYLPPLQEGQPHHLPHHVPYYVAVAFAHENWKPHSMKVNRHGVFYYPLATEALPYDTTIEYRIIVDGTWQEDPANPEYVVAPNGAKISVLEIAGRRMRGGPIVGTSQVEFVFSPYESPLLAIKQTDGRRTFFSRTNTLQVSVVGSFNGWNPYLNPMHKHRDQDVYTVTLPLSAGDHHYYFVVNGQRILDPHNTEVVHSIQGHGVSVVEVP